VSYQEYRRFGDVVVCDVCKRVGAVGDRDWREMRKDARGAPIHLCHECRRAAVWCAAHAQYHLPDSLHRRPCIACGGLFTSQVSHGIEHCPQCRRSLPAPAGAPAPAPAARGAFHFFTRRHTGAKARRV